jgi:hypothetical protein
LINPKAINEAVSMVSLALPQVMAAYNLYKVIWMATNPGKTEDEFFAHLGEASTKNIDESDAVLRAHGYEPDGAGGYRKKVSA